MIHCYIELCNWLRHWPSARQSPNIDLCVRCIEQLCLQYYARPHCLTFHRLWKTILPPSSLYCRTLKMLLLGCQLCHSATGRKQFNWVPIECLWLNYNANELILYTWWRVVAILHWHRPCVLCIVCKCVAVTSSPSLWLPAILAKQSRRRFSNTQSTQHTQKKPRTQGVRDEK